MEFKTKACTERIVVEIYSRTHEGLRGGIPGRILKVFHNYSSFRILDEVHGRISGGLIGVI